MTANERSERRVVARREGSFWCVVDTGCPESILSAYTVGKPDAERRARREAERRDALLSRPDHPRDWKSTIGTRLEAIARAIESEARQSGRQERSEYHLGARDAHSRDAGRLRSLIHAMHPRGEKP
jgi:hypothetical protein